MSPRPVQSAFLTAVLLSTSVGAQVRPDTLEVTLLRAAHPWLSGGGRFVDVQRTVRDARTADSTGTVRWMSAEGTATSHAMAALRHVVDDPESSGVDRQDARLLLDAATRAGTSAASQSLFDLGVDIVVARHGFVHRQGRVDPSLVHAEWSLAPEALDFAALRRSVAGGDASRAFVALEPDTRAYQLLVTALREAREQDADTSFHAPRPPAAPVSSGGRYADAPALATVLMRLGELPATFPIASVRQIYTRPMADAVSRWQNRKLKKGRVTGTLTAPVLAALMESYTGRADRIAMAVERWRWLPRTFSNDPLVVNLPEYRLHTYTRFQGGDSDSLTMNVVIGRADSNATPVFSANMTQVVFSPMWHVPKSIMLKEILPAATANPGYLSRHNYELTSNGRRVLPNTAANIARIGTSVMVRQKSGDDNSLGKVKFLLPNPYDIYLHDTPSRSLFNRVRRDFSHGCVRLGDPMAMAKYVLGRQPAWTDSAITEAMNAGVERYVRVPKPIPVLIVYQTAVAEPNGALRFYDDVYGHDKVLSEAFDKRR